MTNRSYSYDIVLSVVDVKQYFFCPMIPYFNHVLGIYERTTEYEKEGREAHEELSRLESRRKTLLKKIPFKRGCDKYFRVYLYSERLGLRGLLDCLIVVGKEYIPVEYKIARSMRGKIHTHHKYQTVAYALLVEDEYSTIVRRAYLYYAVEDKLLRMNIADSQRRYVLKALDNIRLMIAEELEPTPRFEIRKCRNCGYRYYCPYML